MKTDPAEERFKLVCQCEGDKEKLLISPCIEAKEPCSATLIASFYIDSLEMASSARLVFSKETAFCRFPGKAAIFRPLLWFPRNMGSPAFYTFKAQFFKEAKEDFAIFQRMGFSLVDGGYKEGKYHFSLQEKPLLLQKVSTLCESPGELKNLLTEEGKANFFLLPEERNEWKEYLSICDLYGIMAGILLRKGENFGSLPPELFHHPSLLFLFSTDLQEGELVKDTLPPLRTILTLPFSELFTL